MAYIRTIGPVEAIAHMVETNPAIAGLDQDSRELLDLAMRVTDRPAHIVPADIRTAMAARSPASYLDAVGVIIGFNFIARVANALGVEPEIAPWIRRIRFARQIALRLTAFNLSRFVDLRPRSLAMLPVEKNLLALAQLFDEFRLGALPEFFIRLRQAPHLLESQRVLLDALLARGVSERPDRYLASFLIPGLVAVDEIGAPVLRKRLLRSIHELGDTPEFTLEWVRGPAPILARKEAVIALFARDVTSRSHCITRKRVDELRACGLGDADVLDLVCSIAMWNACARLEILLPDAAPAVLPGS
jgi:alkylhydroperoxidase family enzyme